MKKKLGVIGGMGPEATAYFYEEVIRHTKADCDQDHLDMTILSHASMPDRTKAIQTGESRKLLEAMKEDVRPGSGRRCQYCDSMQYVPLFL